MANFPLANDTIESIPITALDAAGDMVPAPAGDVDTVVSSDPTKMTAVVGVMPSGPKAGAVAVILTPLVKTAPGLTVTITDTAGLTTDVLTVDIGADLTPAALGLDIVSAVKTKQPIPAV